MHARYAFQGVTVDMRGHPHPPLDSWYLGALLAELKSVREVPFHAAYIPFSLIAAWSALALARRFTTRPLPATLLFLATPAFVVNGNSLETDVPFVAFWLAAIALFVRAVDRRSARWLAASAVAMALAALTAYQAVLLVPILLLYGWRWRPAWAAVLAGPLAIAGFQAFERLTSGALPAAVLVGYMDSYGLQKLAQKGLNAVALLGHLGWLVFPVLVLIALRPKWRWAYLLGIPVVAIAGFDAASAALGVLILYWCVENRRELPAQWILVFFAGALVIFFAGSARYLLPVALPLAILVSTRTSARWLYAGVAAELALSLGLAVVNYQHWDAYRQFAHTLAKDAQTKRIWTDAEWGLRFYLEEEGALPLMAGHSVYPGEMVVSSGLSARKAAAGGGVLSRIAEREIRPVIPLRIVGLEARSGYSATSFGLRPFDVSNGLIDRVTADVVVERKPELSSLTMSDPAAATQIVSGIYGVENGQWRWMGGKGIILLKPPAEAAPIAVKFYIPDQAPARTVTVFANDREIARQTYTGPGSYTLTTAPVPGGGSSVTLSIVVDRTFSVPGDGRELGMILSSVGFAR
jgi:hypothetical protein